MPCFPRVTTTTEEQEQAGLLLPLSLQSNSHTLAPKDTRAKRKARNKKARALSQQKGHSPEPYLPQEEISPAPPYMYPLFTVSLWIPKTCMESGSKSLMLRIILRKNIVKRENIIMKYSWLHSLSLFVGMYGVPFLSLLSPFSSSFNHQNIDQLTRRQRERT